MRGIDVPRRLRVSGYDNTDIAVWLRTSLTTVDRPSREMGMLVQ